MDRLFPKSWMESLELHLSKMLEMVTDRDVWWLNMVTDRAVWSCYPRNYHGPN